jgi:hypothetical protein
MTDENMEDIKETEDTEDTKDAEDIEQEAAQEGEAALPPDLKLQMLAESIEPISRNDLFEHGLMMLQTSSEKNPIVAEYYQSLREEYFGPDVPEEEAMNAPIDDERQRTLVCEFLDNKLELIKSDVVSLNPDSINKAFKEIFNLVGATLFPENLKESFYDQLFETRCEQIPELLDEYEILKLNRNLYNIYANKSGTLALNGIILQMEKYYSQKDITREQLAQFYYNIGCIYDVHSLQKNTEKMVKEEHLLALSYKRKALDKTRKNMELILNVHRDWCTNYDYKPQKILDACHRVIDNSDNSRSLYQAHMLYAETLQDFRGTDGFGNQREKRMASIIKHYRKAVNYTENKEEKIDILDMISAQQKNSDKPAYIRTRMEMASLLHYRARIREYSRLVDEADDFKLKSFLFMSGINEFYELGGIDDEDRQLYDDLDGKFRKTIEANGGDAKVIAKLDELKKKYGTADKKEPEMLFVRASTSGHDFFGSDKGR